MHMKECYLNTFQFRIKLNVHKRKKKCVFLLYLDFRSNIIINNFYLFGNNFIYNLRNISLLLNKNNTTTDKYIICLFFIIFTCTNLN